MRTWWGWVGAALVTTLLLAVLIWPDQTASTTAEKGPAAADADRPGDGGSLLTFDDTFDGTEMQWEQGDTVGAWYVQYDSYGRVGLSGDGNLSMAPQPATAPDRTHAALVTSTQVFNGDIEVVVRARTEQQLRIASPPNPWEVAWLAWHYRHDHRFYYAMLRPSGWELGKVDNTRIDPTGPECLWPEYENCKYPGAQRFLATGTDPTFALGEWHEFRVVQSGSEIVLWGDGRQLTRYVDTEDPYLDGSIGLYTEDAAVSFDRVTATVQPR